MEENRRFFLKKVGGIAGVFSLSSAFENLFAIGMQEKIKTIENLSPEEVALDEDFWGWVQQSYTVSPNLINLNNGGVSPQPKVVQDAMIRYYQLSNEMPSYYMWQTLDEGRESIRRDLARLGGCSPEEIAINRNSTEALETVIFGLKLKAGDEIIMSKQDYPNMINAWKLREKRDGVKIVWVNFELPIENDKDLVEGYMNAITEKTKIVHLTHIINWQGQIMPAKKIIEGAHARGCEVLLDAAHSYCHFDFSFHDLNCDYSGSSLHKWLGAPFGSGILYVRKDKIQNLYPLFGSPDPDLDDIRKFEHLGTRSFPIEQAIGQAISFHDVIGMARKEARLRFLKNYWANKVKDIPGVKIHTSLLPQYSCGICMVSVEGKTPGDLSRFLMSKYKIHTVSIEWENIKGVRITPNVYTMTADLDQLVSAIREFAEQKAEVPK